MGKRLNVKQLSQKVFIPVDGLSDEMRLALGEIEDTFTAIIYGGSGNGKTNFTVQLLKELKTLGNALYISYEEAHGKTIKDLILRHNLVEELPNLSFSDGEDFEELMTLLKKKKSPKIVVIDSWQYCEFTYQQYKKLKEAFALGRTAGKRKIIIIISHIQGKEPDGKSALQVKRDANIKILVDHYIADITSRFVSQRNFCIWEKGAQDYWGEHLEDKLNKKHVNLNNPKRKATPKKRKPKPKAEPPPQPPPEPVTHMQVLPEEPKPVFKTPLNEVENAI